MAGGSVAGSGSGGVIGGYTFAVAWPDGRHLLKWRLPSPAERPQSLDATSADRHSGISWRR